MRTAEVSSERAGWVGCLGLFFRWGLSSWMTRLCSEIDTFRLAAPHLSSTAGAGLYSRADASQIVIPILLSLPGFDSFYRRIVWSVGIGLYLPLDCGF